MRRWPPPLLIICNLFIWHGPTHHYSTYVFAPNSRSYQHMPNVLLRFNVSIIFAIFSNYIDVITHFGHCYAIPHTASSEPKRKQVSLSESLVQTPSRFPNYFTELIFSHFFDMMTPIFKSNEKEQNKTFHQKKGNGIK